MVLAVVSVSLLAVAAWEFWRPRRRQGFAAWRRRSGNLALWPLNLLVASVLARPEAPRAWLQAVLGTPLPAWPIADLGSSILIGFLLLDVVLYGVHRCEHRVALLWRFHALHHSDPDLDLTTALRHHPVEFLLFSTIYWLAALLLAVPAPVTLIHGLAVFATAAVQHGNIRLPKQLERGLQPLVMTTDLHRLHHSLRRDQADANYGAVLSLWDRLFGTYTAIAAEDIAFGVRDLPAPECLRPLTMLLTPWLIGRARAGYN